MSIAKQFLATKWHMPSVERTILYNKRNQAASKRRISPDLAFRYLRRFGGRLYIPYTLDVVILEDGKGYLPLAYVPCSKKEARIISDQYSKFKETGTIPMDTMQKVSRIREELKKIEAETPKDGWLCWKCKHPNYYSDARTQVEKDEVCLYVCVNCKEEEIPF